MNDSQKKRRFDGGTFLVGILFVLLQLAAVGIGVLIVIMVPDIGKKTVGLAIFSLMGFMIYWTGIPVIVGSFRLPRLPEKE